MSLNLNVATIPNFEPGISPSLQKKKEKTFNQIPDEILVEILTFLPRQEVSARLVAKRWDISFKTSLLIRPSLFERLFPHLKSDTPEKALQAQIEKGHFISDLKQDDLCSADLFDGYQFIDTGIDDGFVTLKTKDSIIISSEQGAVINQLTLKKPEEISAIARRPNSTELYLAVNGKLKIWDWIKGSLVEKEGIDLKGVNQLAVSQNNKYIVLKKPDYQMEIMDHEGKLIGSHQLKGEFLLKGNTLFYVKSGKKFYEPYSLYKKRLVPDQDSKESKIGEFNNQRNFRLMCNEDLLLFIQDSSTFRAHSSTLHAFNIKGSNSLLWKKQLDGYSQLIHFQFLKNQLIYDSCGFVLASYNLKNGSSADSYGPIIPDRPYDILSIKGESLLTEKVKNNVHGIRSHFQRRKCNLAKTIAQIHWRVDYFKHLLMKVGRDVSELVGLVVRSRHRFNSLLVNGVAIVLPPSVLLLQGATLPLVVAYAIALLAMIIFVHTFSIFLVLLLFKKECKNTIKFLALPLAKCLLNCFPHNKILHAIYHPFVDDYKKFLRENLDKKYQLTSQKKAALTRKISRICPLTQEKITHPAKVNDKFYEEKAILDYVKNHGTAPGTLTPITSSDIKLEE